jgi:putative flippase GtrA
MSRAELVPFLRFCAVGAVGFIVDAGILAAAVYAAGLDPLLARGLSASIAILATYAVNRSWSFRHGAEVPFWRAFPAYVGVQGFGFAVNIALYAVAIAMLPWPLSQPLPALALASATALMVNYAGARLIVFRLRQIR